MQQLDVVPMCSYRNDLARAWSAHGVRDYFDVYGLCEDSGFRHLSWSDDNGNRIMLYPDFMSLELTSSWAAALMTGHHWSSFVTLPSYSNEFLVWIPHDWDQAPWPKSCYLHDDITIYTIYLFLLMQGIYWSFKIMREDLLLDNACYLWVLDVIFGCSSTVLKWNVLTKWALYKWYYWIR
jgi:hypothetical protein